MELGGTGPVLLLAVANGFPPEAYRPVLAPLFPAWRVVCLPPRALWPGMGPPPERAGSWESLADDLRHGMREHGLDRVVAIGHSFGAVALLLAAVEAPGLFAGLALLDPTIFVPARMDRIARDRAGGKEARFALASAALRRRRRFDSIEEAAAYFATRGLFRDWSGQAVGNYARAVLRPAGGGSAFELAWSPEWESWYYRSFYPGTWDQVARVDPSLPILVVGGAASDTFSPEAARLMAERLPWATHRTVAGAGHLFPLSHPEITSTLLRDWLERPAVP